MIAQSLPALLAAALTFFAASASRPAPGPHARDALLHAHDPDAAWTFAAPPRSPLPSGSSPRLSRRVYGYLPYWVSLDSSFRWDLVSDVIVFAAELTPQGAVSTWHGWPNPAFIAMAHSHGVRVHLCATLFNPSSGDSIAAFLASPSARAAAVQTLVQSIAHAGADGLNFDFEFVSSADRDAFSSFVEQARSALKAQGANFELTLAMPASTGYRGYDAVRLAAAADRLLLMEYDFHWSSAPTTGPVAPLTAVAGSSEAAEPEVQGWLLAIGPGAANAVALGVPYYGYDWPSSGPAAGANTLGVGSAVLVKDVYAAAATHGRLWDSTSQTPWTEWVATGTSHQLWYDDDRSLALKYAYANAQNLAGVMIWALGYDAGRTEMWSAIETAFGQAQSAPAALSITSVSYSPLSLNAGSLVVATVHVTNTGGTTLPAVAPAPGTAYDETQSATGSIAGSFRVALDVEDRPASQLDHPWRWGLPAPLAPGASAVIEAPVRLERAGTRTLFAAVIQEGAGVVQDGFAPTAILVAGAADGGAADAGGVGQPNPDGGTGTGVASSGGCASGDAGWIGLAALLLFCGTSWQRRNAETELRVSTRQDGDP